MSASVAAAQVHAAGGASGGNPGPNDVRVREIWRPAPVRDPLGANDLEFTFRNKEFGTIPITGFDVDIPDFPNVDAGFDPNVGVVVNASGANVPQGGTVDVDISLFLTQRNSKIVENAFWTRDGVPIQAIPPQGWSVRDPVPAGGGGGGGGGGQWIHRVDIILLPGSQLPMFLTNICAVPSMTFFADLRDVPCSGSLFAPILLMPGETFGFDVLTTGPLYGGHIYFGYTLRDAVGLPSLGPAALTPGALEGQEFGDHPVIPEPRSVLLITTGLVMLGTRRWLTRSGPALGKRD